MGRLSGLGQFAAGAVMIRCLQDTITSLHVSASTYYACIDIFFLIRGVPHKPVPQPVRALLLFLTAVRGWGHGPQQ